VAVAFDAATETALFDGGSANPFTFTHTPVGTPKGVVLFAISDANATDPFDGAVSYGGVAMAAVSGGRAVDSAGEAGACKAYFLGSSIPTGAQTVSVIHNTGVAANLYAVCITVTASADTEISGTPVLLEGDGTLAEQSVGTGGASALRFAGLFSGLSATPSVGANSTLVHDHDIGVRIMAVVCETTAGTGSRPVGFSSGSSDDRAAVHLSVAESGGGGGAVTRSFAVFAG
jgi:hypothetical protein